MITAFRVQSSKESSFNARTHATAALVLGAAVYRRRRRAVGVELARALTHRGCHRPRAEPHPMIREPSSAAALAFVAAQALAPSAPATHLTSRTVTRYSIPRPIAGPAAANSL